MANHTLTYQDYDIDEFQSKKGYLLTFVTADGQEYKNIDIDDIHGECNHECDMVGGPWISENPNCPIHGNDY